MCNTGYILVLSVVAAGLALLWLPALWFMKSSVQMENTYKDYVKRNVMKQLHDKCSDGELIWVLRHLKATENMQKLNRSEIRDKIVDVQSQQISQWEFGSDDERIISPTIGKICRQNYDTFLSELEANCTAAELHNICNYINVQKCDESTINSKWQWCEEIINVKRTRIDLNVTKLIDKFCIERNLEALATELIASCTGGRIKKIFDRLISKHSGCDVICDECVDKMDFVEAVVEVKRRFYHRVDVNPLLNEFCVQPELKTLKRKLKEKCSGIQIKQMFEELNDKSTGCAYCVEKADFVNEIIDAKRRQFATINVNNLILKYCLEPFEDQSDLGL